MGTSGSSGDCSGLSLPAALRTTVLRTTVCAALRTRVCAALLVGAALAGCSSATPAPPPTASASAAPETRPAPSAPVRAACEVPLPDAWRAAFAAGEVRPPAGERAVLTEVGPKARWTVVQLSGDRRRRAALIQDGGAPRTLLAFADPVEHQLLSADFDGRWAAFAVLEGRTLDSPWTLRVWDEHTGRTRVLARSGGRPGPLPQPVVRAGTVFWAQGTGGGKATVYAAPASPTPAPSSPASSSGGAPRALHTGVLDAPFPAGDLLAWREADASGTATRLSAVSFATLRPAALPAPLARLRNVRAPVSDGQTWAWVAGEQSPALTVWRAGTAAPSARVSGSPGADGVDQLRISGELIAWRTPEAAYALDLRSSAYARITPQYGYAQASDGALAVAHSRGDAKAAGSRPVVQVVRTDRLPGLPGCG
ncbi:hypothetical protein AB0M39_36060 [Streptomyces sp. NPDC051907]|uniref:hypothetical protein n=1 Tax=Streptomyces sp. NPDC051907 TaxID=3155284 RepID=UPI003429FDBF